MTKSISSSVLYTLRLNLIDPCAMVKGTPIARKTWEGWSDPEVQADPDEAQMPNSSIMSRIPSPSTNSKLMLVVLGSRFSLSPLTFVLATVLRIVFSSLSRRALT